MCFDWDNICVFCSTVYMLIVMEMHGLLTGSHAICLIVMCSASIVRLLCHMICCGCLKYTKMNSSDTECYV